jgi:hypothetical protein
MPDVRLIDANALLKEFEKRQENQINEYCDCFLNDAQELSTEWWCVEDAVTAAPTIDAVPVGHGRWVHFNPRNPNAVLCSVCDYAFARLHPENYRPNCGAKMNGGSE